MNITKLAESFIQQHPYIRYSLKKGLINYSSLARMIVAENNLDESKNFDAVLIACRRYRQKIKQDSNEKEIMDLLRKSKVEVKNKVMIAVIEKHIAFPRMESIEKKARKENEIFRIIEGASAITLITTEEYSKEVRDSFKASIIKETKGLVEVTLKTSLDIEGIPGVMAFLYSLFAEYGINIVETMSCWTDTVFIIEEKDLAKVMGIMRF